MAKGVPVWGRMARPEEVANVALFLCGAGAEFVTGVGMLVDAGLRLGLRGCEGGWVLVVRGQLVLSTSICLEKKLTNADD
jgi:hypothetical protein